MHSAKFKTIIAAIETGRDGEGYEISVQTQNRTFTGAHRLIESYAGSILSMGTGNSEPIYIDLDSVIAVQIHD